MSKEIIAGSFAIIGVVLGFSLQWINDYFKERKLYKSLKKQIYCEMDDLSFALNITQQNIKRDMDDFNSNKAFSSFGGQQSLGDFSIYGSMFQQVVFLFNEAERRNIKTFYSYIKMYNEQDNNYTV